MLEAELGPMHAATPASPETAPPSPQNGTVVHDPLPESPTRPKRMPIDVIGLNGNSITRVRQAFEDRDDLDIRFIDPDQATAVDRYRENVVAAVKFINHATIDRAYKYGSTLVRVNGGVDSVVGAIEQLSETAVH
jgi:hypothetical protein